MSACAARRAGLLAVLACLLVGLSASQPRWAERLAGLYAAAERAASLGDWQTAFERYAELEALDAAYGDVPLRCLEAATQVVQGIGPDTLLPAPSRLLHWLAAASEHGLLAQALDRSLARVPAGGFWMGTDGGRPDESPRRRVYLDTYLIDVFEVTNVQYQRFILATGERPPRYWDGGDFPEGQADMPVVGVDWRQAQAYCAWAGRRLPTEAEWEKACRGEEARIYPWGDTWEPGHANLGLIDAPAGGSYIEATWPLLLATPGTPDGVGLRPVGSCPLGSSPYAIHDLVGNATEWILDTYVLNAYRRLPDRNPVNTEPPWSHVLRGSSWFYLSGREAWAEELSRCAARNASHSSDDPRVGFRCADDP